MRAPRGRALFPSRACGSAPLRPAREPSQLHACVTKTLRRVHLPGTLALGVDYGRGTGIPALAARRGGPVMPFV